MDEKLKCAIEAYGEQVATASICAAHPQKIMRTFQHRKRRSDRFPWWVRIDEGPVAKVKQEPEEDEPVASSSSWTARPVEPSDTIADAIAALPHFESLKYPTQERRARAERPGRALPY